ncbi:biological adhesion [Desmophyllum pertusum]|uniref:Biological adhesion n=1 Tax=Desmophyllum pertusum TaxID=174260 RepID=A0A9X0A690_9CNID|nr:biological adhesion [Desmophyllum pertusum]
MALTVDLILMWLVFSSAQLWVITGSVERCKQYPNPKNGHVVCDKLFRLFCAPECDVGFMFEYKPAVVYMCGPVTGEWFTYPEGENIPWPDCVNRKR